MEPQHDDRRLTTILSVDVVGYSRLMATDEAGTVAQVKTHRKELLDPKTAEYHGRVVKLMGDGTLMEFGSVVDAVLFAVDVQRAMAERNTAVPENRRIIYRIGINIGDIIVDGDDIYGDGVNVAARLQALADPGDVCISRSVYNQIKDKVELGFEDLGEKDVKNIPEPVRVFRVLIEPRAVGKVVGKTKKPVQSWQWPAVAIGVAVLVVVAGVATWLRPWEPRVEPAFIERMAFLLREKPSIDIPPCWEVNGKIVRTFDIYMGSTYLRVVAAWPPSFDSEAHAIPEVMDLANRRHPISRFEFVARKLKDFGRRQPNGGCVFYASLIDETPEGAKDAYKNQLQRVQRYFYPYAVK